MTHLTRSKDHGPFVGCLFDNYIRERQGYPDAAARARHSEPVAPLYFEVTVFGGGDKETARPVIQVEALARVGSREASRGRAPLDHVKRGVHDGTLDGAALGASIRTADLDVCEFKDLADGSGCRKDPRRREQNPSKGKDTSSHHDQAGRTIPAETKRLRALTNVYLSHLLLLRIFFDTAGWGQ